MAFALAWRPSADRRSLLAGWGLLAAMLVSPLCNLSVALLSARVTQHLVLLLLAAPLLVLALPWPRWMAQPAGLAGGAAAFTIALWFWRMPAPYAATFATPAVYWAMQISLIASAL